MKFPTWFNFSHSEHPEEFNMAGFKILLQEFRNAPKAEKIEIAEELIGYKGLRLHHTDKHTKKSIIALCKTFEYPHEHHTSKKLTAENYHVLFVPNGYFKRSAKKHDVFLLRNHILIEADLKCVSKTKNPDTIGKTIKEGSEQAKTIIVDIVNTIDKRSLIEGLKTGCTKNDLISYIYLFYNSRFYELNKNQILSKNIFDLIK
jgi:hypothetical protein